MSDQPTSTSPAPDDAVPVEAELVTPQVSPHGRSVVEPRDSTEVHPILTPGDPAVAGQPPVSVSTSGEWSVAAGVINGDVYIGERLQYHQHAMSRARSETFIDEFLKQALRQAHITFLMSVWFMIAGGVIVLCAGVIALINSTGSNTHSVALVSGLGGVIVGASGAAFSVRADRARKHLAEQAARMHDQLMSEQKYDRAQVLLDGVRDQDLNDRARAAMAMKIMDGGSVTPSSEAENSATSRQKAKGKKSGQARKGR